MAPPLQYTPRAARTEATAQEELGVLLETCHEHGVLRLANDLIASNTEIARILVEGLERPGTLNALQNLSILLMALSRIPPNEFYRIVFAAKSAIDSLVGAAEGSQLPEAESHTAPGLMGAYRMLHDEQHWQRLRPLLEALKAFGTALARKVENPISEFSGKSGSPT
jgi:uncharacterized protein YjgD (DUF1641 family)